MLAKRFSRLAATALMAGCAVIGGQAAATTLIIGDSFDRYAGLVDDGIPSSQALEVTYVNNLIGLAANNTSTFVTIGTEDYDRSDNSCTTMGTTEPCPLAILGGSFKDNTGKYSGINVSGFDWLIAKYDGPNYGSVVFYVGGLSSVDLSQTAGTGNWGLSHYTLFKTSCTGDCGTTEIPEPGSLALLGAGLAGLALIRRRRQV